MGWSAPPTAVTGAIITAAFWNTGGRDNLNDLDRRTSPSGAAVTATETTTSSPYTDLATAGPAVSVTIGATGKALIGIYAALRNTSSNFALMSFAMTGATIWNAEDEHGLQTATPDHVRFGAVWVRTGLGAGSTTFTAKYRSTSGTAEFTMRRLWVTALSS